MLGGHEVLLDAFRTDVRPLCAAARAARRRAPRTPSPRCARRATPSASPPSATAHEEITR